MSETTTLPAPVLNLSPPLVTKWEREYQAFLRLLPELLKTNRGNYVAIHDERFVDSGDDPIALIKKVHARFGYVPIHVARVVEPLPPPVHIPHRQLYRGKEPK